MIVAVNWRSAGQLFAVLVLVLFVLAAARALGQWYILRRRGAPLPLRTFLMLRWRGVQMPPIAAANWVATRMGYEIPLNVWISFAMLRVDVVKLAAALAAAERCGIETSVGKLGAAALAGYDPLDVVQAAKDRGLKQFAAEDLNQLDDWPVSRSDKPV